MATDNSAQIEVIFIPDGGNTQTQNSGVSASDGSLHMNTTLTIPGSFDTYVKPRFHLSQWLKPSLALGDNALTFNGDFQAGDFNNDDMVNAVDYALFEANYALPGLGDINGDGIVNAIDFAVFRQNYGDKGAFANNLNTNWQW